MIILDYKDRRPIYEQITEKFQELIIKGALKEDSPMPSVRSLAVELSINPNTIQRAYNELEREGWIYSVRGKGSFVSENTKALDLKKDEWFEDFELLLQKALVLDIPKKEITDKVMMYYGEGGI